VYPNRNNKKKRIRKVYFKLEHEKYIIEKVHLYIILRK
jgi:hypothetical protein